ncbi:polysaccharide deacetylase family protein [Bacillus massiliigorillae]|uniref:polysaccharide deacetylase family protein n=1 Tax=Bacillus massiliigorillae TaxID=1243664 RepID=UPI00039EFC20|nr:polysaccharide deacetylase family protein [Bacillus massiliigorillae]
MKFKLVILLLVATLFTVGCAEKTIGNKEDDHIQKYVKDSKYPELEIETEIGEYDTYKYAIHFPRTDQEDVNSVIKHLVAKQKKTFVSQAKKTKTDKGTFSELLLDYKITNLSDTLLSIVFSSSKNIYGQESHKQMYTLNFDRKTGKQIKLKNLLTDDSSLQKIARLSQNMILQDAKAMELSDVSQVMDGTKPELSNFSAYSFSNNTMDIYLKEEQIGPKEMGTYKVQIALNDLNGVLEKSYTDSLELKIPNETELLSNTTTGQEQQQKQSALTPGVKYVALTFDDGPHHQLTPRILDILKKYNAKATFFVLGNRVEYYPEIVKRTVDEGHEIGSHSWSHPKLTSLKPAELAQQINQTSNSVEKITGKPPATLRPPYGAVNDAVKQATNGPIVNWSVDTLDWKHHNKEKVKQIIRQNTRDGSIILMHDIQKASADALEDIIIYLSKQGYHFVTVSQLLQLGDHPEKYVGKVYTNG